VTQLTLEVAGFRVVAAADGQEAVNRFRERADEITAVVLDVTMPQLSGDEVLAIIRETRPDIPVILSSGYSEQETTERLAGHGPDGFLQKPYSPAELIELIQRVTAPAARERP
jgi:two-component system, cell cycle sensor histidine kinase and response regulator CckA